jgi:hypothetical protein
MYDGVQEKEMEEMETKMKKVKMEMKETEGGDVMVTWRRPGGGY